jgi:WD40 repeat protein
MAANHGVLIAAGIMGEYAMQGLDCDADQAHVEGVVTNCQNPITNHIHIIPGRSSGPRAVISSNDDNIRILDCITNKFTARQHFGWAVNCSATSPCGRLRVVVGDDLDAVITNAETGEIEHRLPGHHDFGFACAWADDHRHIATANQDMQIRIYDARYLKRAVAEIASEMGGARSLHFSPVGSGKRVLVAAEPADIVSIIDARDFQSKQQFDFFGEIAGAAFDPDGNKLYVANSDKHFGGIFEYERTGYGRKYNTEGGEPTDWIDDQRLDSDPRILRPSNHRSRRILQSHHQFI